MFASERPVTADLFDAAAVRGQLQDVDGVGWNATWAFPAPHPPRVAGCERTLKVTYPADLAVAEAILRTPQIEP